MDLNVGDWLLARAWIGVAASPFIGSFAAAASRRYAKHEPIVADRSRCESCRETLRPWELVPLLSWVALKGRCSRCGDSIGMQPLLAELTYLAVGVVTLLALSGPQFWTALVLGWVLLGLALVDLETYLLPDLLTLPLIAAGLVVASTAGRAALLDHALAAALGFAVFFIIAKLYRAATGRDGLGLGDVKLSAAAGAWIGMAGIPSALLLASLGALAVVLLRRLITGRGGRSDRLAFGPYLALAIWIGWIFGPLVPTG